MVSASSDPPDAPADRRPVPHAGPPAPAPPDARPHPAPDYLSDTVETALKVLVVGPFGVGKTTLVGALSEIDPLRTEEVMTHASTGIDDLAGVEDKRTTTVAMDFGRMTLNDRMVLYLFGTPGQQRFWPLWDDLARGALGALVLVDTRRLEDSFDVLGLLEEQGLPFAVAVNAFPGAARHAPDELRDALDLLPETPIVTCDARERTSCGAALLALVNHLLARAPGTAGAPAAAAHGALGALR